jgi:hypothetical protein
MTALVEVICGVKTASLRCDTPICPLKSAAIGKASSAKHTSQSRGFAYLDIVVIASAQIELTGAGAPT